MTTRIVQIGNSKGVKIPKTLLEHLGDTKEVLIDVEDDKLVIRAAKKPRQGWANAFSKMAKHHDDALIDGNNLSNQSSWDKAEWEW